MTFQAIVEYGKKMMNASDHTADVVLAAYTATVICALCWLTHGVYKGKGFTEGWNSAFWTLSTLVGLTKINNTWATRLRESGDAKNPSDEGDTK
jgi:uncharacterized membrane protein